MTTVDRTVSDMLESLKPEGALWCVYTSVHVNDPGDKVATVHGPFDTFDEAYLWAATIPHATPMPLFAP